MANPDDCHLPAWFPAFAQKLVQRSGRTDWPDPDTEEGAEFWSDFRKAIRRKGAGEDEADEASSVVCDIPDLWPNQYRPMILAALDKLFARKQAEGRSTGGANSIDEARAASRGCPDCDGNGIAMRYVHPEHLGRFVTPGGIPFPPGARVGIVCGTCPLGAMIWKLNGEAPREARHRMAFGGDFPDLLRDRQYRYPPDHWNLVDGEPMPEPTPDEVKAQVRAALMAGKGPGVSVAGRSGARWSKASWTSEELRQEAARTREEMAAAGAAPMAVPDEHPDLADAAAMPSDPDLAADQAGWY